MDREQAEQHLVGRPVVVAAQGAAVEIRRMQAACLSQHIAAMVGPCSGSS